MNQTIATYNEYGGYECDGPGLMDQTIAIHDK